MTLIKAMEVTIMTGDSGIYSVNLLNKTQTLSFSAWKIIVTKTVQKARYVI
jgi:hypothetical protein